jgi:hypothetical protein
MENLLTLHGQIDSENATLGLFAIEFMLFGEEGSRKVADYFPQNTVKAEYKERGFNSPSELPNNRRRMLLTLQTGKLVDDLALLVNSWNASNVSSQISAWQSLNDDEKYQVLAATLEQGLAQFLVNEDEHQDAAMLKAALDSLRSLPTIIQHRNKEKMAIEFDALTQLLAKDTNAEQAPNWQAIKVHLNALSKLYAPPTPTPAVAEIEEKESDN